jgi:2-polyprenyl-6-methoxyphenol hydroxylase-like FAD-dependent oxidoreductase
MLGWWNVRDTLLDRVRQEKEKINLHTGRMVQDIVNGEEFVQAKFQKRSKEIDDYVDTPNPKGEIMTLKGLILVGADGVNSAVRRFLELPVALKTNVVTWRGRLKIDPPSEAEQQNSKLLEASELLRPYLDVPVAPFLLMRGSLNYMLFNFHPKLDRTMAIVANYQADDVDKISPGTSVKEFMMEASNMEDIDKESREVKAILELMDKDGMHHPVRMKVVELPENEGEGWGGKGRITVTGDAAHGMSIPPTRVESLLLIDRFWLPGF